MEPNDVRTPLDLMLDYKTNTLIDFNQIWICQIASRWSINYVSLLIIQTWLINIKAHFLLELPKMPLKGLTKTSQEDTIDTAKNKK
jgi:hypothetical protein